jgi:hypothetical protein
MLLCSRKRGRRTYGWWKGWTEAPPYRKLRNPPRSGSRASFLPGIKHSYVLPSFLNNFPLKNCSTNSAPLTSQVMKSGAGRERSPLLRILPAVASRSVLPLQTSDRKCQNWFAIPDGGSDRVLVSESPVIPARKLRGLRDRVRSVGVRAYCRNQSYSSGNPCESCTECEAEPREETIAPHTACT